VTHSCANPTVDKKMVHPTIDLTVDKKQLEKNAKYCRERGIIIPTFDQMKHPDRIPAPIKKELSEIGLWDVHPRNLFRITWKNEQVARGGGYGGVNYLVFPPEITGVKAKIIALCGKFFPTGAHKVGATFGCLAPRLVTGQFDPTSQKAVWPSTGNFCRGGAYVSALLGCASIAILPQNMSRERFEWLSKIAGEVIATPGCESNVKEIFDKCWELRNTRKDIHIFNQFEEFGNPLWHYEVTGSAMQEALEAEMKPGDRLAGSVFSSGSAGTLGSGYFLKTRHPHAKLGVAEALQCPTLVNNGYGDHRIEGIGDKHVPWIHDLKNTDMVIAVDDEHAVRLLRLFNEAKGREVLKEEGVPAELINKLSLMGISGIGNFLSAIKMAKYYELTEKDIVVTVLTDSLDLYGSRLQELEQERGGYDNRQACRDFEMLQGVGIDHLLELSYYEKKRIHNLKYFTWVEQQARDMHELNQQWNDHEFYWGTTLNSGPKIDDLIQDFNALVAKS
jgi:cysteine synthase